MQEQGKDMTSQSEKVCKKKLHKAFVQFGKKEVSILFYFAKLFFPLFWYVRAVTAYLTGKNRYLLQTVTQYT